MAYADHRQTASKLACTVMRLTVRRFARRTQIALIRELAGRAALAIISLEVLDRACGAPRCAHHSARNSPRGTRPGSFYGERLLDSGATESKVSPPPAHSTDGNPIHNGRSDKQTHSHSPSLASPYFYTFVACCFCRHATLEEDIRSLELLEILNYQLINPK